MSFEMIVGLFVVDQQKYTQYRAEIAPLLQAEGGRFRYDFEVSRVLKSDAGHDINRLFVSFIRHEFGAAAFQVERVDVPHHQTQEARS